MTIKNCFQFGEIEAIAAKLIDPALETNYGRPGVGPQ